MQNEIFELSHNCVCVCVSGGVQTEAVLRGVALDYTGMGLKVFFPAVVLFCQLQLWDVCVC